MREKGVVEEVFGENAVVCVIRKCACGESCKNCSSACKLTKNRVTAINSVGAKHNDVVLVEAESKDILKSAFLVYILPLIVFFIGYFITNLYIKNELICIGTAIILFCAVFIILHTYDKKNKLKTQVKICEIVRDNN